MKVRISESNSVDFLSSACFCLAKNYEQALSLINELSETQYNFSNKNSSSIGAHLRHVIERAELCFKAYEQQSVLLDYDARERDLALETRPELAQQKLVEFINFLADLAPQELARQITVKESISTDIQTEVSSTFARELLEQINHNVHHFALIKLIALELQIVLPADFGKAFATQIYEQQQN